MVLGYLALRKPITESYSPDGQLRDVAKNKYVQNKYKPGTHRPLSVKIDKTLHQKHKCVNISILKHFATTLTFSKVILTFC